MSRTERLFELMQVMRCYRYPVSGAFLAELMGVSLRTLYRDIQSLQAQGAQIEGEAGIGYLLCPGFMLPPLMFSEEEIAALVLGSRWVAKRGGDSQLQIAAQNALAKIAAVLPPNLRQELDASALLVGPGEPVDARDEELVIVRQAIQCERKLFITYLDANEQQTDRLIWPFALGFFERTRVLAAWCELRQDFRHFRMDRLIKLEIQVERYPKRRQVLLKTWRELQGIPPQ